MSLRRIASVLLALAMLHPGVAAAYAGCETSGDAAQAPLAHAPDAAPAPPAHAHDGAHHQAPSPTDTDSSELPADECCVFAGSCVGTFTAGESVSGAKLALPHEVVQSQPSLLPGSLPTAPEPPPPRA